MTSLLLVMNLIALFVIGFIQDILGAYYLRLVNENRLKMATFISFVHNLTGWGVWVWFMYQFQNSETMSGFQAVVYSIGSTAGTWFGLKKPGEKHKI